MDLTIRAARDVRGQRHAYIILVHNCRAIFEIGHSRKSIFPAEDMSDALKK
jgi:hypothetical protein